MTPRRKIIQGRTHLSIPNLRGAMVAVAKRASWPRTLGVLAVVTLLVGVVAFFVSRNVFAPNASVPLLPIMISEVPRHPLTGEQREDVSEELPQVFAVMVENSYEAWPLSGLNEAFLVIEAPVEGNIPRFISFFYDGQEKVDKIGPVRSARPYYLDWADEFDALYVHVGGSPEALDSIAANGTTHNFDQFFQDEYFWRDTATRFAPHNVYTSTAFLSSALDEVKLGAPSYGVWVFKDDEPAANNFISLTIDWASGSSEYDVTWKYANEKNAYDRLQNGIAFKMTGGGAVTAKNIAIVETGMTVVDAVGRRRLTTTGEGKALVYQDGKKVEATWKKPARTDRLRFFTADGKEIAMNAGKTWIEVVPSLDSVTELLTTID